MHIHPRFADLQSIVYQKMQLGTRLETMRALTHCVRSVNPLPVGMMQVRYDTRSQNRAEIQRQGRPAGGGGSRGDAGRHRRVWVQAGVLNLCVGGIRAQ